MMRFTHCTLSLYLSVMALLFSSGLVHAQSVKTLSDVEQQIRDTSEQLRALDQEIALSNEMKKSLVKSLNAAQGRAGEREQRLQGLDGDIERYGKRLNALDSRLADAQKGVDARKFLMAEVLRNSQSIGKQTSLKIILQNDDPATADRLGVYTEYVLAAQNAAIQEHAAVLLLVQKTMAAALKDRNWLNYLKKKASGQRDTFASSAKATQRDIGQVEAGLDEKTRTVAQLNADQQRLQSLMEELKALQSAQSGYFIAGKGKYPAPVKGRLTARFGDIKSVGKLTWSGMFIEATTGISVRAIADGEIIYSNWLQGFGHLVIIDHGDNYTSLYGGNRQVTMPVGDWVESGATIATVGDSGGQNLSGVYFEIRHNAIAVDPEIWLIPNSGLYSASK
jgi:septal ring factor EnvC (AmiA/AmiB activator)